MAYEKASLENVICLPDINIEKAINIVEKTGLRGLFICDEDMHLLGIVTDADIRRAMLNEVPLRANIRTIMKTDPYTVTEEEKGKEYVKDEIIRSGRVLIPVIDSDRKVIDFIYVLKELQREKYGNKESPYCLQSGDMVLVVGGTGYIGSVLCNLLLKKYRVRVLDLLVYGDQGISKRFDRNGFELMIGDFRNIWDLNRALMGVKAVVHLGEIVGDPACSVNKDFTVDTNFYGTYMLAQIAKNLGISRFVYTSSCSVYGSGDGKLDENSELNPLSLYARCKVESERGLRYLSDNNFFTTILRLSTVFGLSPRMRYDLVVNVLAARAVKEKKITISGGDQWRPFIHVEDVARFIIAVLEDEKSVTDNEIINVGSNELNYTIREIGELVKQIVPDIEIAFDSSAVDNRDYKVSFDKLRRLFDFRPAKTIEDGVREIVRQLIEKPSIDYNDKKYSNVASIGT